MLTFENRVVPYCGVQKKTKKIGMLIFEKRVILTVV